MYTVNLKNDRLQIVSLFYRYFVLNYRKEQMQQDILSEKQVVFANPLIEQMVLEISAQVDSIKAEIQQYLKEDWSWERLPNLVKACLIEGVFEIKYTNIDKPITIDSITEIVKDMQPDWDYKFVNAVLDKFNKPTIEEGDDLSNKS